MTDARLSILVKYYPPYPRISGVLAFVSLLAERLAERLETHVITSALPDDSREAATGNAAIVHRVGSPFPVHAARRIRRIDPTHVLVVSGVYQPTVAAAYFAPLVLTRHPNRRYFYQATWPSGRPGVAYRLMAKRFTGVLAASSAMSSALGGVNAEVLLPAVDVARLNAVADRRQGSGFHVGFINHMNSVKGADLALAAIAELARRLPNARFSAFGEGDLKEALFREHSSVPRLEFGGYLPEPDRFKLMAECDVMLLPFRQAASVLGVAQTALEVMALGNVVVGSESAALSEAIISGVNGVLLPIADDDVGPFVDAVARLHDHPHQLETMRSRAASDARERWDIDRRVDELVHAFELS